MKVGFRVDASLAIGTGHVMRCLTLADALSSRGAECVFVCRLHPGHLLDLIKLRGHKVVALPVDEDKKICLSELVHAAWLGSNWQTDAKLTARALGESLLDWLVVDHYALDQRWEAMLRPWCKRLMVIDDLADRAHDCDILLDQNLGCTAERYKGLVSKSALLLMGPQFAMLRSDFSEFRNQSIARRLKYDYQLKHLLITMGGVDKDDVTGNILSVLATCGLAEDMKITVVMGMYAPWLEKVQRQANQMKPATEVLVGVSDMARLMGNADLAIGAAGGTAWERCCLGLPSLVLILADNQRAGAVALQNVGAAQLIEQVEDIPKILSKFSTFDGGQTALVESSRNAANVTDGKGVKKVCEMLLCHA